MIVTDCTRMFQAHFVAASSRNKEWPGKQHSKLINECGAEGTRTPQSEGMGASGPSGADMDEHQRPRPSGRSFASTAAPASHRKAKGRAASASRAERRGERVPKYHHV